MGIISKISVGNTMFYEVDSPPTHFANKGDVAINNNIGRIYINNDGSDTWLKTINKEYGIIHFNDNTIGRNTSQDGWTNLDNLTWTNGVNSGFNMDVNGRLFYKNNKKIRVLNTTIGTISAGLRKWLNLEFGGAFNNSVPFLFQGSTAIDTNRRTCISCNTIENMGLNDFFNCAVRWVERESGGGVNARTYIPLHSTLNLLKIDEADLYFNEDWESNNFNTNNWTVLNDTTNQWIIGSNENNTLGGTRAAYISSNGSTAIYNDTTPNVSHIYVDIEIPSGNSVLLTFDWKCWAENSGGATQYDYGVVTIVDTNQTPVIGSEILTTQAPVDGINNPTGNGRIGAISNLGKFNEGYGGSDNNWRTEVIDLVNFSTQNKRIIFSWINDFSVGNNPPFVIDNIKIETF